MHAGNAIQERLAAHVGCPVVLSDGTQEMPEVPYCYYGVLAPRSTGHAVGLTELVDTPEGLIRRRSEPVSATMSFTFCSKDREATGGYIYGEDEALALAEKAHGFFLLNGHNIATEYGDIVIQNIGSVTERSGFIVTDMMRRFGFDIRFGYMRADEMPATTIEHPGRFLGSYKKEE